MIININPLFLKLFVVLLKFYIITLWEIIDLIIVSYLSFYFNKGRFYFEKQNIKKSIIKLIKIVL